MLDVNAGIPLADEPQDPGRMHQAGAGHGARCRSRSTPPSSRRWRPGSPSTRASRWSTPSPARRSGSSACCRWSRSTARPSSPSPTTRPASPRTRTCASRSPRRSSSAPPTSAFRARTSWSTRWSCRSAPSTMPGRKLMHLLRRLQGELKVNTTCGASNFSFGLPNRRGLNASFLPMMIGAGMTSAIMNPLHLEDIQAILGADVVMGHDPNCARLDPQVPRAAAEAAEGAAGGRRERRRARGRFAGERGRPRPPLETLGYRSGRADADVRDPGLRMTNPLVVFTPSGKRGRFPEGTSRARGGAQARRRSRFGLRRARHLRALPGRGRRGQVLQARHRSRRRTTSPAGTRSRSAIPPSAGALRRRPAPRLPGASSAATSSSTCRRTARSIARSCASAPSASATSTSIRSCASTMSRCASPTCTIPRATSAACRRRSSEQWGIKDVTAPTCESLRAACRRRCAPGEWTVTVAVRHGREIVGVWPGLHEQARRARRRHRLDHHRRPSLRPGQRRGARLRRAR